MRIYICGDSTAASYTGAEAPICGWGQMLQAFLPGAEVVNKAAGGRSSKSFVAEGRLIEIEKALQPGDLMLIQFAHNDGSPLTWRHTDAYGSYVNYLRIYIETARRHNASPILLTPVLRNWWDGGTLLETHGEYPEAVRHTARIYRVPLLDMYSESRSLVLSMGKEASKKLFMYVPSGVYPAYPDGAEDSTHTCAEGAEAFAKIAARLIRGLAL